MLPPLPDPPPGVIKLRVQKRLETVLRQGHPWVYDRGITAQQGDGPPGTLATIYDQKDRFLAVGLFDPLSPIRLRVLQTKKPARIDRAWFSTRLAAALELRSSVASPATTGYRLVHGENDGFPGMVIDRYGEALVMKLY